MGKTVRFAEKRKGDPELGSIEDSRGDQPDPNRHSRKASRRDPYTRPGPYNRPSKVKDDVKRLPPILKPPPLPSPEDPNFTVPKAPPASPSNANLPTPAVHTAPLAAYTNPTPSNANPFTPPSSPNLPTAAVHTTPLAADTNPTPSDANPLTPPSSPNLATPAVHTAPLAADTNPTPSNANPPTPAVHTAPLAADTNPTPSNANPPTPAVHTAPLAAETNPTPSDAIPIITPEVYAAHLAFYADPTPSNANPPTPAVHTAPLAADTNPTPSNSIPIITPEVYAAPLAAYANPTPFNASPPTPAVHTAPLAAYTNPTPVQVSSRLQRIGATMQTVTGSYTIVAPEEGMVRQLLDFHGIDKDGFHHAVGRHFLVSDRAAADVFGRPFLEPVPSGWTRDWVKYDALEKNRGAADWWGPPAKGTTVAKLLVELEADKRKQMVLEEAIRRWARSFPEELAPVLEKACYTQKQWPDEYLRMAKIKRMPDGPAKKAALQRAKKRSPRHYAQCMADERCGRPLVKREELPIHDALEEAKRQHEWDSTPARPTQFHAVPWDERAVDKHGNKLPWALEWHDDHPNVIHRPRKREETGAFGNVGRREGALRDRKRVVTQETRRRMLQWSTIVKRLQKNNHPDVLGRKPASPLLAVLLKRKSPPR
ncbi:hypothetical protein MMC07_009158 [Pseudocyphellaria aurata]|nr:hypothetical protein [Pseudocyphellaria aurata]